MRPESSPALRPLAESVLRRFENEKRVLSMDEYLTLVQQNPQRHTRDAAAYLKDCFDHYGSEEVSRPWGKARRWKIFDLDFGEGQSLDRSLARDRLIGHESIQMAVYRALENFVQEGRINRLLLLHGPNGSAKTTFTHCLFRALEHYSAQEEGAVYRFSWIFPRGRDAKLIGFGSLEERRGSEEGGGFAHLSDERIEVKLRSELREHPLLLLPLEERRTLLEQAFAQAGQPLRRPDWLWKGQLTQKNRQIFEALLTSYRGDLERVLSHVQIERYYVSRRYRTGAVTIGPQMSVDASERQLTADRSLAALPASLSSLILYEAYGELVDGSGGIIEFSDLLKRPLDAWKYLLLAIETGEVSLSLSNLPINSVLVASSNELHLSAFREHHEYNSFRGRLQLIRVPYLLDYTQEQSIYDAQIASQCTFHVAPHATFVAAYWAVLTRLRRADPEHFSRPLLGRLAADLSPSEKAELYALGTTPQRLAPEEGRELRSGIEEVYRESESLDQYEGLLGASPREVRSLLLDASRDPRFAFLSPLAVLERIEVFCQRRDYEFLKEAPDRGYRDPTGFVRIVRERWLDRVDEELRAATGLVDEERYLELFDRYITHVSVWTKREKVYNRVTGRYEEPDLELMRSIEDMLDIHEEPGEFRRNLIPAVAAYALDHPGEAVNYASLFPHWIARLKQANYQSHRKAAAAIAEDVIRLGDKDESLDADRKKKAEEVLRAMIDKFGYVEASARDAILELLRGRYR